MSDGAQAEQNDRETRLAQLAEQYFARVRAGESVSVDDYATRHPDLADEIRELFPSLELLESSESTRPPVPASLAGTMLGEYRLLREIGRGGMGVVYEAEQESLGRRVALKVLPGHCSLDPRFRERFQLEAQAAARLHHPGIVPVFGVGEADGVPYFAMQFIDGHGLDVVIDEARRWFGSDHDTGEETPGVLRSLAGLDSPGPIDAGDTTPESDADAESGPAREPEDAPGPPDGAGRRSRSTHFRRVARMGLQTAEALAYAHGQGTLHRDIKPSNLLLDSGGKVWIADFGLCKADGSENLTQAGDLVGTLRYMAPERFSGQSTIRSDVYSLGTSLYELAVLRPAFTGSDRAAVVRSIIETDPPRPSRIDRSIPSDLEAIILKATCKEPEGRYASADDLAADLRAFLEDRPVTARAPTMAHLVWLAVRRNRAIAATVAVAVLLLVCATAFYVVTLRESREEAVRESLEARRQSVLANLSAAESALRIGDCDSARRWLARVPEEDRHWEWHHFASVVDQSLSTWEQRPHGSVVVRYSPDGALVARANFTTITLTDAETGEIVRELRGHRSWVVSLEFSRDGRLLLSSSSAGKTARLWDVETGEELLRIRHPWEEIWDAALSPDENRIATASRGYSVRLWDAASGALLDTFEGHTGKVTAVAFAPGGGELASASEDGTARIWSLGDVGAPRVLRGHHDSVNDVEYSPDGARIVTCSADETIRVWDAASGKAVATLVGHDAGVRAVSLSPDGELIASASDDHTLRLWSLHDGRLLATLRGHSGNVADVDFRHDGARLVSVSGDSTCRQWDAAPVGSVRVLPAYRARTVAFMPGGDLLFSAGGDGLVRLWDLATDQEITTLAGHATTVIDLEMSPDGARLASVSIDGVVRLWDATTLQELAAFAGEQSPVGHISFSPDGSRLLVCQRDGTAMIRSLPENVEIGRIEIPAEKGAFSPDGRLLALRHRDLVTLVDPSTGRVARTLPRHGEPVHDLCFSPDGAWLVTTSWDRTARLWDARTGELIRILRGHTRPVLTASFSHDGSRLATASIDSTVRVWAIPGGDQVATLVAAEKDWVRARFSPDGTRIAAASWTDGVVKVWSTEPRSQRVAAVRAARKAAREGRPLVEALFDELGDEARVTERLLASDELDPDVRRAAIRLARTRKGRPDVIMQSFWSTLCTGDAPAAEQRRVLGLLRAISRELRDPDEQTMRGLALLRSGNAPGALTRLLRAEKVARDTPNRLEIARLAALALTHMRLKNHREASETFLRLEEALAGSPSMDEDSLRLVGEARETVRICPFDLRCVENEDGSVTGRWEPGFRVDIDGYELRRDGELLRTLPPDATEFTDDEPGRGRVTHYALVPIVEASPDPGDSPCTAAGAVLRSTVVDTSRAFGDVVRINMGGPDVVDSRGRIWWGDPGEGEDVLDIRPDDSGGAIATLNWAAQRFKPDSIRHLGFDPESAADRSLFTSVRWGKSFDASPFRLELPLAEGRYTVRFYLCENYWHPPESRGFRLEIEGEVRESYVNARVFSPDRPQTGWAGSLTFNDVPVTDGSLSIGLLPCDPRTECPGARDRNPTINVLEVIRAPDPPADGATDPR